LRNGSISPGRTIEWASWTYDSVFKTSLRDMTFPSLKNSANNCRQVVRLATNEKNRNRKKTGVGFLFDSTTFLI